MRFLRRSLTGLLLTFVTLALLTGAGYKIYGSFQERMAAESRVPPARERQFAVNVTEIAPTRLTPMLTSYGQIAARRSLELRAPAAGRIVDLTEGFEDGGAVKAGDVILRIDPVEADAALRLARADLLEAEAELRDAERAREIAADDLSAARAQLDLRKAALDRQVSLFERGVGSASSKEDAELSHASAGQSVLAKRQSLANAEAAVDSAKTAVLRAEIDRDEAERTLSDMTLTAAFDGVLSEVSGAMGTLLNTNEQVAVLIDPSELDVAFRISTEQYARLVRDSGALPRMPVRVTLDVAGLDLSASGEVVRESASVEAGQSGRTLYARLDQTTGFRPGDFVTVTLEEPELSGVARLPATALAANDTVLAVTDQSRLEEIPVTLMRRQGDDVIIRADGLKGRQVVSERTPLLGAGIRVKVNGASTAAEVAPAQMIALSDERRAALLEFVASNTRMPEEARARISEQLSAEEVPADLVERLENRMGS